MSKISLTPNASGTGTFTIASPNGNTDRTINLPDSNGTILTTATPGVPVNGPAFSALLSTAQTIPYATFTKLQLASEEFDTNSNYDTANYRFTPTVAGYYAVEAAFQSTVSTSIVGDSYISVYKNGSRFKEGKQYTPAATQMSGMVAALVYLNGSTDYIELYVAPFGQNISYTISTDNYRTYFSAFLARSAT